MAGLEYEISVCSPAQRDAVRVLCRDAFLPIFTDAVDVQVTALDELFERDHILVANCGEYILGFGAYDFVENDSNNRIIVERQLKFARVRKYRETLLLHFRSSESSYGGEVVLDYFDNVFTQSDRLVHDEDMVLTHLVIDTKHRKRGIGQALAEERLRIARQSESTAVYVECWEANGVTKLYEKLGFHPIIRGGPTYRDGSAQTFMGLLLKQ